MSQSDNVGSDKAVIKFKAFSFFRFLNSLENNFFRDQCPNKLCKTSLFVMKRINKLSYYAEAFFSDSNFLQQIKA